MMRADTPLKQREKIFGVWIGINTYIPSVGGYTDNLIPFRLSISSFRDADTFSHDIQTAPKFASHGFVDQDDFLRGLGITFLELAATEDRDAQHAEIAGS